MSAIRCLLVCMLSLALLLPAAAQAASLEEKIAAAQSRLMEGDVTKEALGMLEKLLKKKLDATQAGRVNYLAGLATSSLAIADINDCLNNGEQKKGKLQERQIEQLRRAIDYFMVSHDKDPDGEYAAQALARAGRLHDVGCLTDFGKAEELYRRVVEEYPGTETAEFAQGRLDKISYSMENKHGHP